MEKPLQSRVPVNVAVSFVVALGFVLPGAAHATWPRMDQGTYVVGTAVALPQQSRSLLNNPAGLASQTEFEGRVQLALGGSNGLAARGAGWSVLAGVPFGPFGLGLAIEHVRDPAPGAPFGPGIAQLSRVSGGGGITFDRWLHVGGALRLLTAQADPVGTLLTTDVGILLTPWPWLTFGARVSDLVGVTSFLLPDTVGGVTGPQYTWGWALRYEDQFKWSVDLGWPSVAPITEFATTLSARIGDDYEVAAEYRHTIHNEVVTGHSIGSDARIAVVLRWTSGWYGGEAGVLRDMPEGDPRANGAVLGANVRGGLKVSLWDRGMQALGVGRAGILAKRAAAPRAKAPEKQLSTAEIQDIGRRTSLGWQAPLKGKYRREARKVAAAVSAFSALMASENTAEICSTLAAGRLRFDIATLEPPLNIHTTLEKQAACVSFASGELARYVKEFGPSHPHADIATIIPALFAVHSSPYLHLPRVQLQAYGDAIAGQKGRSARLACKTYRAARLPADAATPAKQRRYEVTITCARVVDYHVEVMGNRTLGFKVRKLAIRRIAPPQ